MGTEMVNADLGYWPIAAPVPKKILLAAREAVSAAKIRDAVGSSNFCVVAPDLRTYVTEFDILIMSFDPLTDKEQRWFHTELLPLLKLPHTILWTC